MGRPATPDQQRERRYQVSQMMLGHVTQEAMARQLKTTRQTINADVQFIRAEWKAARIDAYDRYVAEDIERLAALEAAIWDSAMAGKWLATDRCLSIIALRARLLGTEAPTKTQVTVITEDATDAAIRQLESQLAGGSAPGEAASA